MAAPSVGLEADFTPHPRKAIDTFAHEDGEGFNILLQAMPLDGKLVLRTYKEKPEEQEKVIEGNFKK